MRQILLRLGLRPRAHCGRLQRLPRTTGRPTSNGDGREGKEKEGEDWGRVGMGKNCSVPPPTFE